MNKKTWFSGLVAGAALTLGGFALAQSTANPPPSSTPGAGCTATANAMRGGNLGGSPSATACAPGSTNTAAAAPAPDTGARSANRTAPSAAADTGSTGAMASSTGTRDSGSTHAATRRVARADRN